NSADGSDSTNCGAQLCTRTGPSENGRSSFCIQAMRCSRPREKREVSQNVSSVTSRASRSDTSKSAVLSPSRTNPARSRRIPSSLFSSVVPSGLATKATCKATTLEKLAVFLFEFVEFVCRENSELRGNFCFEYKGPPS